MNKRCERKRTIRGVYKLARIILLLLVLNLCIPNMVSQAASIGTSTASILNIRKSPSTSATILGKISKGTKVSITSDTKDKQGALWYKVKAPVNGKSVTGYVSAVYIKKTATANTSSASKSSYVKRYGKIRYGTVNIRKSPTVNSKSLGNVKKSVTIRIINEKKKGKYKWYLITKKINGKQIQGYIRSDLIKLLPTTVKTSKYQLGQAKVKTTLYKTANTSDTKIGKISKKQSFLIRGSLKVHKTNWVKVKARINGKSVTGYLLTSKTKTLKTKKSSEPYVGYTKINVTGRRLATTLSSKRGLLKKGSKVTILGYVTASGSKWYQCRYKVSGKYEIGYISTKNLSRYATTTKTTRYQLGQAKDKVKIYQTANTSDTKLGTISKNQQIILRGGFKVNKTGWTKVIAKIKGKNKTGYVLTSKIKKVTSTVSSTKSDSASTKVKVTGRRIASTIASSRGTLEKGAKVTVEGAVTVSGTKWYKCKYSVSGKSQTGYINASYLALTKEDAFEKSIAGFPSSYKSALRKLHQTYPNWKFVPINTGLNWSTVIENQTKLGRNTISTTAPSNGVSGTYSAPFSYLSTASGAYDWSTDTYKLCDGNTWYTASEDVVKYYMDPRNAFSPTKIFQFESLAYNSAQTKGVVTSIFKDTFMNGSYTYTSSGKKYKKYYNSSFMTAGKSAGVSPYFLAARARQELGVNGSQSITGSYPGYVGYYNYFNIGANDSAGGGAIANGLKFAKSGTSYSRPWNTPYKAITGGAKYIAVSYIEKKQNTLYFQKFSVVNSPYYYWHQYMTNVQAPTSESNTTYNAYNSFGITKDSMVFYIPVYNNMPSTPCALPARSGNPNSYLKELKVKNGSKTLAFNKTFSYKTTSYNMVVKSGVNSISVSAKAVSNFDKGISGTGTYDISALAAGKSKTIKVICTAGNGTTKTYTIKITRAVN